MTCIFCDGTYCKNRIVDINEYEKSKAFLSQVGKTKKVNTRISTYGLKHKVEKWSGIYICGCSLAQAAKDLGFTMRRIHGKSPNWLINFSIRDVNLLCPPLTKNNFL